MSISSTVPGTSPSQALAAALEMVRDAAETLWSARSDAELVDTVGLVTRLTAALAAVEASAVAEVDVPFYAGMKVGVPSLPAVVEVLSEGRYDVLHVCAPGPAGVASALIGRVLGLPIAGSYHTELTAYTALRSGDAKLGFAMEAVLRAFYGGCDVVLSPSRASDERLLSMGVETVGRWDRGGSHSLSCDLRRDSPDEQ